MNDILKLLNKYNKNRFEYINNTFKMTQFLNSCFDRGDIDKDFFIRNKNILLKDWIDYYYWCLKIDGFIDIYSPEEVLSYYCPFSQETLYNYLVDDFSEINLINSSKIFSTSYLVKILMSYKLSPQTVEFFKSEFKNNAKIMEVVANWQ